MQKSLINYEINTPKLTVKLIKLLFIIIWRNKKKIYKGKILALLKI
jgi:hypothetical protein